MRTNSTIEMVRIGFYSCDHEHTAMMKLLLKHGADPNRYNDARQSTPNAPPPGCRAVRATTTNPSSPSWQGGDTPLRLLCSCDFQEAEDPERADAIKALLNAGADPNFYRDAAAARSEVDRARARAAGAGHSLGHMRLDGSPSAVFAFVHGVAKLHELQLRVQELQLCADAQSTLTVCPRPFVVVGALWRRWLSQAGRTLGRAGPTHRSPLIAEHG